MNLGEVFELMRFSIEERSPELAKFLNSIDWRRPIQGMTSLANQLQPHPGTFIGTLFTRRRVTKNQKLFRNSFGHFLDVIDDALSITPGFPNPEMRENLLALWDRYVDLTLELVQSKTYLKLLSLMAEKLTPAMELTEIKTSISMMESIKSEFTPKELIELAKALNLATQFFPLYWQFTIKIKDYLAPAFKRPSELYRQLASIESPTLSQVTIQHILAEVIKTETNETPLERALAVIERSEVIKAKENFSAKAWVDEHDTVPMHRLSHGASAAASAGAGAPTTPAATTGLSFK